MNQLTGQERQLLAAAAENLKSASQNELTNAWLCLVTAIGQASEALNSMASPQHHWGELKKLLEPEPKMKKKRKKK